jgi:Lipopolysaccharide kinase (Kdo/WaaP) family
MTNAVHDAVTVARLKKDKKNQFRGAKPRPVELLVAEIRSLRQELRATIQAYGARLEIALAEAAREIEGLSTRNLSSESLDQISDLTRLLQKRKLKPSQGRQKDLRKLATLIDDLHEAVDPDSFR